MMKTNRLLIWLIVAVVVMVAILLGLMWQLKGGKIISIPKETNVKINVEETVKTAKVFFPENTEATLGGRVDWKRESFQPIFNGTYKDDTGNYLKILYSEKGSTEIKEGKVYLPMQIPYSDENRVMTVIDGETLMKKMVGGEQFRISYISMIPDDFDNVLSDYCTNSVGQKKECLVSFQQRESNKTGTNIFYPMGFYQKLYK